MGEPRSPHVYNTTGSRQLSGDDIIGPFAAALLQHTRYYRFKNWCPHCRTYLHGEAVIDMGRKGIRCSHCPTAG